MEVNYYFNQGAGVNPPIWRKHPLVPMKADEVFVCSTRDYAGRKGLLEIYFIG